MASNTRILKRRRQMKLKKQGTARKARIRRDVSTPAFPIHPEGSPS